MTGTTNVAKLSKNIRQSMSTQQQDRLPPHLLEMFPLLSCFSTHDELNKNKQSHSRLTVKPHSSQKLMCHRQAIIFCSIALTFLQLATIYGIASEKSNIVRNFIGVPPDKRSHYELRADQTFKCLDGSGVIPIDAVNDDYCDCRDASDEPGTAACPHGRFHCYNTGYIPQSIPAGWVNDNRCDCCDGSDEHNSSVKCENSCFVLGEQWRSEQEKFRVIAEQGSAVRSQYKDMAKKKREEANQLLEQYKGELSEKENAIKRIEEDMSSDFGPDSVFYPLKGECYKFTDLEYTYSLCPFDRAIQESQNGMQTELGRWSSWAGPPSNLYSAQKYEGGLQCWNGPMRSAFVSVTCGVEDKVVSVSEPSRCEYAFEFISPAACPDMDSPTEAPNVTQTPEGADQVPHPSMEVEDEGEGEVVDGVISGDDILSHDEL